MGHVRLLVPTDYFNKDFLDIEVKKKLAVRGDQLQESIKEEYSRVFEGVLSHKAFYICEGAKNGSVCFQVV